MISIVYPIKNRRVLFQNTLDSIKRYKNKIDFDFEILLLDSGSNDNIEEIIPTWKKEFDIKYIKYTYPNLDGFHSPAFAINLGFQLAKFDSVILGFSEILHVTDVIVQFKKYIGRNVLAKVYDLDEKNNRSRILYSSDLISRRDNPGLYFLAMYNKKEFLYIGGIDEKFMRGIGYEDKDFGIRFRRAHFKYNIDDNIIGEHQWHCRKYQDNNLYINARLFESHRDDNDYIIANSDIIPGNKQYIIGVI